MQNNFNFPQISPDNHQPHMDDIPFSDEIPPYLDQKYDNPPSVKADSQDDLPTFLNGVEFDAAEIAERSAKKLIHQNDPNLITARVGQSTNQASFFEAKTQLTKGPEWQRTLAQASRFRSQAAHSQAQAKFITGVVTERTQAETDLAHARSIFVAGPDTRRAQSQAEAADAAALMNWAKAELTQGAETKRTLAEAKKMDMDRYINLATIIGKGIILITLVVIFLKYMR